MKQQWLVFLPVALATAGLAACASVLGGEQVKIRPVDTLQSLPSAQRDPLYESAVAAINERDYGRALEYLQAAKAKDPRNVKALNALGVVYDKLGRFDLSARYYAQARAVEPGSKIVAENMGYSSVLQRLLNPGQQVAVANIDLPADLVSPASPAPSVAQKKAVDTPPTMTAAPLVLPDAKPIFASVILPEPAMPVTERKLIDTPPPTVTAMPLTLPDARHVFASVVIPEPVMPVAERKLIDTPAPAMRAMPLTLPDANQVLASVVLPEPVMPVTERKLIDAPRPAMTAMPLTLLDASHVFASVILPEPVAPVIERKVIDAPPPTMTAAPVVLADTKPLFAAPLSHIALSLPIPAMERTAMAQPAPSAAIVPAARPVATPVSAARPQAEAKPLVVSAPAVPAIAPPPAKPVVVASSATPRAPAPEKKNTVHIPAVAPSIASRPAMPVRTARAETPATIASPTIPAKLRTALAVSSARQVAAAKSAPGKVLFIGQPIRLVNASGKAGGAGTILRRLTTLGWTMRSADSRIQTATTLFYPVRNLAAAKAMQRTLPFPVRLVADSSKGAGMRLVVGRDYLSWKPKSTRIAALWQKRAVIASAQKLSLRGVR